jgi:molybdopterin-guanine dinucleotide biosynthesis protein A
MIVGIFVGGRARRMGGRPKGLLPAPDTGEPLVVRSARLARALGFTPVLVGTADAYRAALPELTCLADAPAGVGPLGGLSALLGFAGAEPVIALACDMPLISESLLSRLAAHPSTAQVLAARGPDGLWEPLCARYASPELAAGLARALSAGVRSFQALFSRLHCEELALSDAERAALVDWDTPEDVTR